MAAPVEATLMLGDCLRLLSGASDEHRLAGLLLAAKFCRGDDKESIIKIHNAVGAVFLNRLLKTGMMREKDSSSIIGSEDRDAYLRLSVTILSAFCRVPEIASSEDMISKIPVMLEILSKTSDPSILDECHEFLLLVIMSSVEGSRMAYESGTINIMASSISNSPEGSSSMELATKILQVILTKLPLHDIIRENPSDLSKVVIAIARQFGIMHSALKFDTLHLLTTILSSDSAVMMHDLRNASNEIWPSYIRTGIMSILQNRVVSDEKLYALSLVDSMMSVVGERWLLDCTNFPGVQNHLSIDKCLLLVLESARVEVAVLLNDLARLKYEESGNSSSVMETVALRQRNLAVLFSLIEKIIKLIANDSECEGSPVMEHTIMKAINGIDETVHLVLDFLTDAKDHGESKGDDLLASVRLLGSYLAEVPFACREKVLDLLEYILSVEGKGEQRPFYSICFMLPMLCQTTVDEKVCDVLVYSGGHKSVVNFLISTSMANGTTADDSGAALLACDTIKNLFLNRNKIQGWLEMPLLVQLFQALAVWTENNDDPSVILSSACVCVLALDCTSEDDLLEAIKNFDQHILRKLSQLLVQGMDLSRQGNASSHDEQTRELCQIFIAHYPCLIERFPSIFVAAEK